MQALALNPAGIYVDATFGRGGHARAILSRLGNEGRLLAADRDPQAVSAGQALATDDARLSIWRAPFSALPELLRQNGVHGRVAGALLDLGLSSPQLDDPQRGFSFSLDGPLDMRMDNSQGETAADWLARADQNQIAEVLRSYGEERFAIRIARAIVAERARRPLRATHQLADLIARAVPTREPGKHPATRAFQALRIEINAELQELRAALAGLFEALANGGRLVAISFHSLEDRIVKHFIRDMARGPSVPKSVPIQQTGQSPRLRAIGVKTRPSAAEVACNPRARSAILRVAERLS